MTSLTPMLGPRLSMYSESLVRGRWTADAAGKFFLAPSLTSGREFPEMPQVPCPQNLGLYGVLSDEVWETLPWSLHQRGFPEDASKEVSVLKSEWENEAYGHNFMTLEELSDLYTRLRTDSRAIIRGLDKAMGELLYYLSASMRETEPQYRRIVYWFN